MWVTKCIVFLFSVLGHYVASQVPKFRVLAPQFICPKDENSPIDKPDNTVITIHTTAGSNYDMKWAVRWTPIIKPSQRFTLMLWKAVRALEVKLNSPQPVPLVYIIDNDELLRGVDYVFTVNAYDGDVTGTAKTFHIDNSKGDQKLEDVDGRADLMSLVLIGGDDGCVDLEYLLEGHVTTCYETQDYYFKWTVISPNMGETIDMSYVKGSRLIIPPYSLKPGLTYSAKCEVIKPSSGLRITQTDIELTVKQRYLELFLSVDYLMVTMNYPFTIDVIVRSHDYYNHSITFSLKCKYEEEECDDFTFSGDENEGMISTIGLSRKGKYQVSLTASVMDQAASAAATIVTVANILPVIQVSPLSRVLNEGDMLVLIANASNVAPTCTLGWYFATKEYLDQDALFTNGTCSNCQHGEPLSDILTINSLQENFLNELTDYTNETEWRQIVAETPAAGGRARFVAQCGCSLTFECETEGTVYADLEFILNQYPTPREVMVSPETGVAMETEFRLSTLAVVDAEPPLRYSFYTRVGSNDTLLLAWYLEHMSVETMLPYMETGTEVWVEVCDVRGACSVSDSKSLELSPGDASTLDSVSNAARAHVARCEILALKRLIVSAVTTYTNAGQTDALSNFTGVLQECLPSIYKQCSEEHSQINLLFNWLSLAEIYKESNN